VARAGLAGMGKLSLTSVICCKKCPHAVGAQAFPTREGFGEGEAVLAQRGGRQSGLGRFRGGGRGRLAWAAVPMWLFHCGSPGRGEAAGPALPARRLLSSHRRGMSHRGRRGFPSLLQDPAGVIPLPRAPTLWAAGATPRSPILLFFLGEQSSCSGMKLLTLLRGAYGGIYTPRART